MFANGSWRATVSMLDVDWADGLVPASNLIRWVGAPAKITRCEVGKRGQDLNIDTCSHYMRQNDAAATAIGVWRSHLPRDGAR
jgi:hypothetical protein